MSSEIGNPLVRQLFQESDGNRRPTGERWEGCWEGGAGGGGLGLETDDPAFKKLKNMGRRDDCSPKGAAELKAIFSTIWMP